MTLLRTEAATAIDLHRTAEALERAQRLGGRPGVGGHLIRRVNAALSACQRLQDTARGVAAGRPDPRGLAEAINAYVESRAALSEAASVALAAADPRMRRAARRVLRMLDGDGEGADR